ncbi:MAG: Lrp/AsnC family transcriptional regulator [archaeon]
MKDEIREKVLKELKKDARQSDSAIAKKLNCAQSTVFRTRKALEDEQVIIGYSALTDCTKMGWTTYMVLFKASPPTKAGLNKIISGLKGGEVAAEMGVEVIDVYMLFGDFEWSMIFSAKTEAAAQKYFNYIKDRYKDFIDGRPEHSKIVFVCQKCGHTNPKLGELEKLAISPSRRATSLCASP